MSLAFRAALRPEVRATVCFYPTGVHDGRLDQEADAGTLARAAIAAALTASVRRFGTKLFPAEHAFMRGEGPRYDPEAADRAWDDAIVFLRRAL